MVDNLASTAAVGIILFIAYSCYVRTITPPDPPNTPVTVPYMIPWIGSFFTFNRDPLKFLKECHLRHGKVYKIYAAGRTLVIVTDPDAVAFIARDINRHLDHKAVYTPILRGIAGFDCSIDSILELLDNKIFPIFKTALCPASMLKLTQRIDICLFSELHALETHNRQPISVNLSELIGRPLYNAGSHALFGPTFPLETLHDFLVLDAHLPQLLTQLPIIARRGRRSRLRILSQLEKYIETWWDSDGIEDIPGASASVILMLVELKAAQVTRRDAACTLLLFLWGFHSNMWYMMLWLLTHLVSDETSMARMVADIETFSSEHLLDQLDDPGCTPALLESAIQETLRWATTSTTARYVTEDTVMNVGGTPVPVFKGECVLGDIRAVHHDPEVYDEPYRFKIDRYLLEGNERKSSTPKPSPWGRGKHMCLGRHVAMHIMRRFVVELLSVYRVTPVKPQTENSVVPPISVRHFLGSITSTQDILVTLVRRT